MKAPSVKILVRDLDWLPKVGDAVEVAKKIRAIIKKDENLYKVLDALDLLCDTHGVEGLGQGGARDRFEPPYQYLNAGDTYTATLVYSRDQDRIFVSSWGEVQERLEREFENET